MEINDETVRGYHAARQLLHLYGAYRATARAQLAAFQQIRRHLVKKKNLDTQQQVDIAQLRRREMLAIESDAVFGQRREQLRRRLLEIQGLEGPR